MKQASLTDRRVKVQAYITNDDVGLEHWRASEFSTPPTAKPAMLLIFDSESERDAASFAVTWAGIEKERQKFRELLLEAFERMDPDADPELSARIYAALFE